MTDRVPVHGLQVARELHDFIAKEALPGTGVDADRFWKGFAELAVKLMPENRALLAQRDKLQAAIDAWHKENPERPIDALDYTAFLREIGYLVPEGNEFQIGTQNVDPEIATMAGPQLVVPLTNARFALNAVNARWGSLYDALYGTDVIAEDDGATKGKGYNPVRGAKVIAWASAFLDEIAPLAKAKHADVDAPPALYEPIGQTVAPEPVSP